MHLLAAQAGAIQQEGEAIDLAQTPGKIVFAGSAESELALLAAAADRALYDDLRLANLLRLAHNLSVDMWLEKTVRHADLVVLRLLGGPAYWQYGVDELTALAASGTISLALFPGEAAPDPLLRDRSTIPPAAWDCLFALLAAGGAENADRALAVMRALAAGETLPDLTPAPLPRFGLWQAERHEESANHPSPRVGEGPAGGEGAFARRPGAGAPLPSSGASRQSPQGEKEGRSSPTPSLPARGRVPLSDQSPPPPHAPPDSSPLAGEDGKGLAKAAIPLLFYRALLDGAGTAVIEALTAALQTGGFAPLPLFVSSLREPEAVAFVQEVFATTPPAVILNLTGFALGIDGMPPAQNPFAQTDAPVIQLIQSGRPEALWAADTQGLSAKDLAMQVVMPELDGRIGGLLVGHRAEAARHARTQCPLAAYAPDGAGIACAAELAANWARLRETPRADRRIALILANYPIRDGRLANGVGYDAPQSTVEILRALAEAGYDTTALPADGNALIALLQAGPTNAQPDRPGGIPFPLADYRRAFATLPEAIRTAVIARWGEPEADPFVRNDNFHLPALRLGNIAILLQPSRGYHLDEAAAYHDPDLVPPHGYLAAYLWLKHDFAAHAIVHNGKHGNLEWLPGKAVALDAASYPLALWGALPHLYPFIVNDPGEGTQAKRRTGAVIIDHLVPPLTRAETYGPLKDLEALLDEYYAASGLDRRRLADLRRRILGFAADAWLDADIALPADEVEALKTLDTFLCDLKEAQIRDGLHIFGRAPDGRLERDLVVALARVPRGETAGDGSLIRALADDLKLGFDPLTAPLGEPWTGPMEFHEISRNFVASARPVRKVGDVVEHLEAIAAALVEKTLACPPGWPATAAVLATVETTIRPRLAASGPNEIKALLDGLDGKFVAPGPSGAPSRGRLDVLPTGRNFYSVDNRAVPTPTAWELGKKSAENLLLRHLQDQGVPLKSLVLSAWGTANMRTGGDDVAQALAFIGVKPVWDPGSLRISGYEIIPLARLGRPRVDVTLRISGFFRDAFPAQIALFDRAVRAVGALDEPEDDNPIAARMRADALGLAAEGASEEEAARHAGYRIFGSKPGAYGAGLQGLIDSGKWTDKADLAEAFLDWGQYAYGARDAGAPDRARLAARLSAVEAIVQNQDNREHDLLDSDDYYQFEGGLAATAESLAGRRPALYHNDHSRPDRPLARTLEEEIARVVRSRVVNPKWIEGVKRHGYKGAFEIIATVDYMFAFAATTGAVKPHQFDLAFAAFVEDPETRNFIKQNNRFGYAELIAKFNEARARGLWMPRSNSAHALLANAPPEESADA